ncbi:MAG: hypothetical protein CUN51_08290 [Candidatus Thermofonsia Clade 1 bacterium]|uniref:Uncharacterized protein n=1 Tax=Candidatus Thermofonsia Clade 1 bacterium TaxID=2364210 RepID=A0A2M8NYC6_9CHLR|nr:MAG: hypothetical protein CUN51_08290 [Candidatus Thermofonsia Clade 1 bacterium]
MTLKWFVRLIVLIVLLALPLHGQLAAQDSEEARAIALAAKHPRLATYLSELPNWSAVAYSPGEVPNVWRVLFRTAQGDMIAEADVLLVPERVLWLEVDYSYMSPATHLKGEEAALNFAVAQTEVQAILGTQVDKYESYTEYDSWRGTWSVYLWHGGRTVRVVVRFTDPDPLAFRQPELVGVTFPEALSVSAWLSGRQARAITLATRDRQVAARLRENSGWQAEATPEGTPNSAVWRVTFRQAERIIAQAWVDLVNNSLIRAMLP